MDDVEDEVIPQATLEYGDWWSNSQQVISLTTMNLDFVVTKDYSLAW